MTNGFKAGRPETPILFFLPHKGWDMGVPAVEAGKMRYRVIKSQANQAILAYLGRAGDANA